MNTSPTSKWFQRKGGMPSLLGGVLLAVSVLGGCSQAPSGNSAHVAVVTPYTPQAASGAIVSQTVPVNTGVTKVEVVVTDSATGQQLASVAAAPGNPLGLDVEPGAARLIAVSAIDGSGDTLFAGSVTRDLNPDTSVTLPVDLFGKLLKGSSNLTAGTTVKVLDDTGASVTGSIDANGDFRIALSTGMVRPYLLLAQDGSGNVVSAAITDSAGPTSLNPVTQFQAGYLMRPVNSALLTDWQNQWSAWSKTGSTQSSQLGVVDTGLGDALALAAIGETQFQVSRTPSATTWAMGNYNGLQMVWNAGSPELRTSSGSVVATLSAGAIVSGNNAILIAPYSGTGLTASNKTAVAGDWLIWKAGSTVAPLAITPSATTLSGHTAAEIGAALRAIANEIEFAAYDPSAVTGTAAQALATFFVTPLETVVVNGLGSTTATTELSTLGTTMASSTFSPGNLPPVFTGTPALAETTVAINGSLTLTGLGSSDPNGDTVTTTYAWESSTDNATWSAVTGQTAATFGVTSAQAHLYLRAIVTLDDGFSGIASATTGSILVSNTAPAFGAQPAFIQGSVVVGGTLSLAAVSTYDMDGDTVTVAYQWKGSSDGGATYTAITGATSSSFVVPQANAHQTLAVDVTASDGQGGTTTSATAGLTVANSAPVLTGATLNTPVNTALPGTLSFSDPDGDILTFTVQTAPTKGGLGAIPASGTFTYTPNAGVFGTDFFTVQADDGFAGTSAIAQVDLAILPVGVTKVWMGGDAAGATDWSNGANWSPVGVPAGTDGVMVPVLAANQPALTATVSCASLYLESGASLALGAFNLNDSGSLSMAGATLTGTGTVILTGSGDLKAATLPNLDLQTNGTYILGSALSITGTLSSGISFTPVLSSAALQVATASVNVNGLVLSNTPLTLGVGTLTAFDNVTFSGFASTATQLTVNSTSLAAVFNGLTFSNFPTTGSYIVANDTDGVGTSSLITLAGAMPQYGTPKVTTSGGFQVVWGTGNEDSDGDTYTDAHELAAGSDPLVPSSFPAGTSVAASSISTPTTWSLANGPYLVTGSVTLLSGGSLNLDPGVVVKFSAGAGLVGASGATLNLNGTAIQPVVLTSLNDLTVNATAGGSGTPVAGDWSGVQVIGGAGTLSNADIRYASNGLTITNASPSVTAVAVSDSSGYGVQVAASGAAAAPVVNQLVITNSGTQGLYLTASNLGNLTGTTVNNLAVTNAGSQGVLIDTSGTAAGSTNSASITNFTVTNSGAEGVKISSAGAADIVTPTLDTGSIAMPPASAVPALWVTGSAPNPFVKSVVCDGGSVGLQIDTAASGMYLHNVLRKAGISGASLNTTGAPTISTNNIVLNGNVGAGSSGGGINIAASGAGTQIKHNLIRNNVADLGGAIYIANGGVWNTPAAGGADLSLDDNLIVENAALLNGGGIYLNSGNPNLGNNTIAYNLAGFAAGGGGLYVGTGAVAYLMEDIIAFNDDSQAGIQVGDDIKLVGTVSLVNQDLERDGSLAGTGALTGADPLFTDNWYLSNILAGQVSTSPAVDVGNSYFASNYPYFAELLLFTTRTDGVGDTTLIPADKTDLGYHHQGAAPVVDAAASTVVAAAATLPPNSTTDIVITPNDAAGVSLGAGLQVIATVTGTATLVPPLAGLPAGGTTMQAADMGDGTYVVTLQSGTTTGSSDTVSVTVNGVALSGTAVVAW